MPSPVPIRSVYVHVPFCARKCDYCAFYSEPSSGGLMDRYVRALIREFESAADGLDPHTLFFGGGTPSLLNLKQWTGILDALDRLKLTGADEWTVECNPSTVSLDKARLLRERGVNRVSLGVQSLDESLLERLGRVHSRGAVFRSFDILRRAGFENINLDLMFALPGQTRETWRATLSEAIALGSEHLSCYEVIYEEDTPLYARLNAGEFDVDEDLACVMYEDLSEAAAGGGFRQYEIANFAKGPDRAGIPRRACRHNVNYWRGGAFRGFGPSATSYVEGTRSRNRANTTVYCEQIEQGVRPIESTETLEPLAKAGETAAFGLRMNSGWNFDEFLQVTAHDLRIEWASDMRQLAGEGIGRIEPDRFHLTEKGLRFADHAAELFLRP